VKWWKYLFWFMVDVAICNAFILMKESANHVIMTKSGKCRDRTQLEFRQKLVHQMIGEFRGKRKRESIGDHQSRGLLHWPAEMDKKRTCKQCAKKKIRRERIYGCEQCCVNLCVACFKPYHKEKYPEMFN
jgi:ribosomal protein L37AE/L43A